MGIITRGRLINKFVAVVSRFDTEETADVVGGGYDPEFDEPLPVDDGTQLGASSRRYMAEIRIPVQLDRKSWGETQMTRGGKQVKADIVLVFHWPDLFNMGLIDSDGEPILKKGDRIDKIETRLGATEATFKNPPGMFIDGMERAGHGQAPFGNPRTNLLYVYGMYDRVAEAV